MSDLSTIEGCGATAEDLTHTTETAAARRAAGVEAARAAIAAFLRSTEVYEVIPDSSKVVVFDVNIPVRLAFYALVEHEIKSAPIWDAEVQNHVGMFTVSDFIDVVRYLHRNRLGVDDFAALDIRSWLEIKAQARGVPTARELTLPTSGERIRSPSGLVCIPPTATLYDAAYMLCAYGIHRLPVVDADQQCVLSICAHIHVLQYLVQHFRGRRSLFEQRLCDLELGTFADVATVGTTTTLLEVMEIMAQRHVSAVPVVDGEGRVLDVYCRSYVILMARDRSPLTQLQTPVGEILTDWKRECEGASGLYTCTKEDKLDVIFEKFAAAKVHRLVCVDSEQRCVGIVSLTDLLSYFLDECRGQQPWLPGTVVAGAGAGARTGTGTGTGTGTEAEDRAVDAGLAPVAEETKEEDAHKPEGDGRPLSDRPTQSASVPEAAKQCPLPGV